LSPREFAAWMKGHQKGAAERIVIAAHQSAVMMGHLHSKKGLKGLDHYLKPKASDRDAEARRFAAQMGAMGARGLNVSVKRVDRAGPEDIGVADVKR
jgi:hypothetical protein